MRVITVVCTLFLSLAAAAAPHLAFSDLVNGPAYGLNDGLGQGAIVTVWAHQLGDQPGNVVLLDAAGVSHSAAHLYYWKKADGVLPSGPANLYRSHQLYEVAFSIPNLPIGTYQIQLSDAKGQRSNTLPFNVVAGQIFHIKPSGNNNNIGSFSSPWRFINGDDNKVPAAGGGKLQAGDVVYVHDNKETLDNYIGGSHRAAIFLRRLAGRKDAHIALVSYPGKRAWVESPTWGIHPYMSSGIVVSKFDVRGGLLDKATLSSQTVAPTSPSTAQITTSQYGRIIGNVVSDMAGRCSNGYAGAITGGDWNSDQVSIFGNEIFGIGCAQTSHFHHTTYMTRRTQQGAAESQFGDFAWNYLHDNQAKFGIHFYDESTSSSKACDSVGGELRIYNNVITNQRSAAISVHAQSNHPSACWSLTTHIYNNVLQNVGLGPVAELTNGTQPYAMLLGGAISGKFIVSHNLVMAVSDESSRLFGRPAVVYFTKHNANVLLFTHNQLEVANNVSLHAGDDIIASKNLLSPHFKPGVFDSLLDSNTTTTNRYEASTLTIEDGFYQLRPQQAYYSTTPGSDFYGRAREPNAIVGPFGAPQVEQQSR